MNTLIDQINTLHTQFSTRHKNTLPGWLASSQQRALSRLGDLGFPSKKNETWKYTSLRQLDLSRFTLPARRRKVTKEMFSCYLDETEVNIVIVDGFLSEELSTFQKLPPGLTLSYLSGTECSSVSELKEAIESPRIYAEDAFSSLNQAFTGNVIHLEAQKNTITPKNVHIIFISTEFSENCMSFPRIVITAKEGSNLRVQESYVGISQAVYFHDTVTDVFVHDNAEVCHLKLQRETSHSFHISTTRVYLQRDARYESFVFSTGARIARNNLFCQLEGENCESRLNALYVLNQECHLDNYTLIDHKQPHCTSKQLYKGILRDKSHGVFNGSIAVRRDAQGTSASQLNKNLLMSREARIDTKPELKIDADDVRCTHGATIGQLRADELFYLQSRGLTAEAATSMLAQGYVQDVVDLISDKKLRDKILNEVSGVL